MTPNSSDPDHALAREYQAARWHPGTATHQTIKLTKGRHSTPEDGASVMELASMLAGEPFGDHPESVCPVIASVLRAYDDSIDDDRRQDLYSYAAKVVGSCRSYEVQRARAKRLAAWTRDRRRHRWTRLIHLPALRWTALQPGHEHDAVAIQAIRTISRDTDRAHLEVLALVDELLALDLGEEAPLIDRIKRAPGFDRDLSSQESAGIRLLRARHKAT